MALTYYELSSYHSDPEWYLEPFEYTFSEEVEPSQKERMLRFGANARRKTKNEDISRITKNKLDEIYNQLNRELDKLNDVEILDKNYTWPFPKTIFDSAYRMPLKEELIRCVSKIFDKRPDKE